MEQFENLVEVQKSSERVFDGKLLHVVRDTVVLPDQRLATRELMRHFGAVGVVPVTESGNVILERQFRYPLNMVITEIPAGKLDSADEDRLSAAKRELREETGLSADHWTDLGVYYPAAAYSDEKITLYLAQGLHQGKQQLDQGEFLNVYEMPLEEAVKAVMAGEITDGKTQVALLKAQKVLNGAR